MSEKTYTARKEWFEYLQEHCLGSSGEGGSLIGMRKMFWGKDAYVIRCCRYLFHVDYSTFTRIKYGSR